MKNKKEITLIVTTILLVLLISIGASFAWFSANITGGEDATTITVAGGSMRIVYNGGANITSDNIAPSNNAFATKTFTVTGNNTTDLDMHYNLNLVVTENTFTSTKLEYKLTSTNTNNNGEVVPSTNKKQIKTGASTTLLGSGSFTGKGTGNVHTYNLELYFPETGVNQNEDMSKSFKAYVDIKEGNIPLDPNYDYDKDVNKPVLATGMTPVVWNGTDFIETTTDDTSWYDYDTKQWANARTNDGSYWVWIPRYAYKITSGYHSSTTGEIDVKFLKGRTNETVDATTIESEGYEVGVKDTSNHYFLHPAFQFNDEELGFWVAKYESSNSSNEIKFEPNVTSWRSVTISNMFSMSEEMKNKTNIYGWNETEVDTHMMKNSEWGAVAYLSKSKYGAHTEEVWINSNSNYRTGCSGTSVSAAGSTTCVEYHTENGVKASTTHNIYGVYDMSGGAWEYTSAYVDNGHSSLTTYGSNVVNSDSKYKNIYSVGATDAQADNYVANNNVYGDAVYETSNSHTGSNSWYGDYSYMPRTSNPFFLRGGYYSNGADAGVFSFHYYHGDSTIAHSWRSSVVAKSS